MEYYGRVEYSVSLTLIVLAKLLLHSWPWKTFNRTYCDMMDIIWSRVLSLGFTVISQRDHGVERVKFPHCWDNLIKIFGFGFLFYRGTLSKLCPVIVPPQGSSFDGPLRSISCLRCTSCNIHHNVLTYFLIHYKKSSILFDNNILLSLHFKHLLLFEWSEGESFFFFNPYNNIFIIIRLQWSWGVIIDIVLHTLVLTCTLFLPKIHR